MSKRKKAALYEMLVATDGGHAELTAICNRNPDGPQAAALLRVMMRGLIAVGGVGCIATGCAACRSAVAREAIAAARAAGVPET